MIEAGDVRHYSLFIRPGPESAAPTFRGEQNIPRKSTFLIIEDHSEVHMMELIIKTLSGEICTMAVNPTTTIGELKKRIAQTFKARPSQIKLSITNGQILQLQHDEKMVSEYHLCSGSTVMVLISNTPAPIQVFVKNEKGQTKTYDVTEDETVDQFMKKIFQKEGTPVDQQRLIYNGRQLDSGRKLQDYDVVSGSTVHMTLRLRGG